MGVTRRALADKARLRRDKQQMRFVAPADRLAQRVTNSSSPAGYAASEMAVFEGKNRWADPTDLLLPAMLRSGLDSRASFAVSVFFAGRRRWPQREFVPILEADDLADQLVTQLRRRLGG